jgi:hypothetical protein
MLSSEIDLLMYSTFAVQSGESARKQRLAPVFPYVLLWSNRALDQLSKSDSRNDPHPRGRFGRTRGFTKSELCGPSLVMVKMRFSTAIQ